jgi:hypothetical protein
MAIKKVTVMDEQAAARKLLKEAPPDQLLRWVLFGSKGRNLPREIKRKILRARGVELERELDEYFQNIMRSVDEGIARMWARGEGLSEETFEGICEIATLQGLGGYESAKPILEGQWADDEDPYPLYVLILAKVTASRAFFDAPQGVANLEAKFKFLDDKIDEMEELFKKAPGLKFKFDKG